MLEPKTDDYLHQLVPEDKLAGALAGRSSPESKLGPGRRHSADLDASTSGCRTLLPQEIGHLTLVLAGPAIGSGAAVADQHSCL